MDILLLAVELIGTFAFAVSGALLAARKGFDVVGSVLLASMAGLGGGVIRDVLIGYGPPLALENPVYLAPVLLAVALVMTGLLHETRLRRTLLVFDAVGLSLFCLTGTVIAWEAGLTELACVLLGISTAVGGGAMRDVVANETPQIFNPRGVYAVPAMLGAALTVTALSLELSLVWAGPVIALVVFALRMISLRRGWRVPLAGRRFRDVNPGPNAGPHGGSNPGPNPGPSAGPSSDLSDDSPDASD
ncbi:trimeric intracellular cation channel family protein [Nesterenkonia halotolerans]|uniref:trimeric intracellular cation channel family protein n=1 Tax=Nesterenkonia halotolerans TaxID=225325 RepID=UPI003EE71909